MITPKKLYLHHVVYAVEAINYFFQPRHFDYLIDIFININREYLAALLLRRPIPPQYHPNARTVHERDVGEIENDVTGGASRILPLYPFADFGGSVVVYFAVYLYDKIVVPFVHNDVQRGTPGYYSDKNIITACPH
jgi:hypothetical protein